MRRTGLLYGSAQISTILECQRACQRPPYGWRWRLCFCKNGNVAIRVHLVATFGWYFTFNPPPWVRRQFWLIRGLADSASPRFPPFCHHSSTWRPLTACRHIATLLLPPLSHPDSHLLLAQQALSKALSSWFEPIRFHKSRMKYYIKCVANIA